jgi:hypothetical protein
MVRDIYVDSAANVMTVLVLKIHNLELPHVVMSVLVRWQSNKIFIYVLNHRNNIRITSLDLNFFKLFMCSSS